MRVKSLVIAVMQGVVGVAMLLAGVAAQAAGPRWVSGPPFFWPTGFAIAWYTNHPMYYTDAGDLSASVSHAAADAMVARAAAVWNVPTASLVLAQGGSLDEHVTGAAITVAGQTTPVMPADVQAANFQAKQIAVIYDTDGSVIDALLGAGGSDPSGCLQTGVVESVDSFGTSSTIQHAMLILNGRCTGVEPEKQLQMQYQLERAFGRVLGLGWSQTNDNVFTSVPVPTKNDAANWPIMHPIDVICGAYTYQCLPQPFTLRADDISALSQLYFIWQGQGAGMAGKQDTLANATTMDGYVTFPNGQGMEGVNVTVRRRAYFSPTVEEWQTVSAVSGYSFRQQTGTPIAGQDGSALESIGTYEGWREGYWLMSQVPLPAADPFQTLVVATEPVNPLYTGPYALSTTASGSLTMAPSGSAMQVETDYLSRYYSVRTQLTANDAVSDCHAGADGVETAPAGMAQTGWWTGVLCGYGHSSWTNVAVKANRSLTMEVTAMDETGAASMVKAMPMVGVWRSTDATGVAPTVAVTPVAFNSFGVGLSTVTVGGTGSSAGSLRMVIADARGAGRPDFAYQARVLYADTIQPANVGANGGTVVITGTGFRAGNVVTVNGVAATVTAVTATTITAVAPSLRAIGSTKAVLATVVVRDVTTNGVTTMTSALGYGSVQERLQTVSAPAGTMTQGKAAATAFSVQVMAADGVTPVANETVTFAVTTGYATFGACGAVSCTVKTNAQGVATTTVTPTTVGTVAMSASTSALSVTASFTVVAAPDVMSLVSAPAGLVTVGAPAATVFAVRVVSGDGVTPVVGEAVVLSAMGGGVKFGVCGGATCTVMTNAQGVAASAVTPTTSGAVVLSVAAVSGSVTSGFTAGAETMSVVSAPTGSVTVGTAAATMFAVRVIAADGVSPVIGEAVQFGTTTGTAILSVCGAVACTVATDVHGVAQVAITPMAAGTVTVAASAASGNASAMISGTVLPDVLQVVQTAGGTVYVGDVVSPGFAVRLVLADGRTAVAGQAVTFTVSAGTATLGSCGAATCTAMTNAAGVASTTVTPLASGVVAMSAQAAGTTGALAQTASLTVLTRIRTVTAVQPVMYVAEGVAANWTTQVALSDNSAMTDGVAVLWTNAAAIQFATGSSMAHGDVAAMTAQVAGLGAGVRVQGTACAWGGVCGTIAAEGVSAAAWQVQVVSGAGQQVSAGAAMQPVVMQVTDAAGHAVMGANVTLYQAVTAWQQACMDHGRCAAATVLNASTTRVVSDANGLITLAGSELLAALSAQDGSVVQITAAAGTRGTATVTGVRLP